MSWPTPRSRRTRNSTVQSVELLNRVNSNSSTTPNTALPRPRHRKLNNKRSFTPRGGDVFDVPPSSPEPIRPSTGKGNTNSAPGTRRSTRTQKDPTPRSRSTRNADKEPRRESRSPEVRILSDASDPDFEAPDQKSAESSSEEEIIANPSNGDEVSGADVGPNEVAYGNADHETSKANGLRQPASEDEPDDSSAEQEEPNEHKGQGDSEQVPDSNNPTERAEIRSPASSTRKRKLPAVSRESRNNPEAETDQDEGSDANLDEADREPLSDEDVELASDSHERPQKRARTESHRRPAVYVEIANRRQRYPTPAVHNQSSNPPQRYEISSAEEAQHSSPAPRDSREPSVVAESIAAAGEYGTGEFGPGEDETGENETRQDDTEKALFEEARTLGDQNKNWNTLFKQVKSLQHRADISMSRSFDAANTLISELRDTYKRMRARVSEGDPISSESVKGCENLLGGISTEADQILDTVWLLSKEGQEDRARRLLNGFETLVIPKMAILVGHCFLTYYVGQNRFPKCHLHRAMTLLRSLCDRVFDQTKLEVVKTEMLSKKLRVALRRLISALESGSLNLSRSERSRIDRRARPFSLLDNPDSGSEHFPELEVPLTRRTWTDKEGTALVEGLKQYQGMLGLNSASPRPAL